MKKSPKGKKVPLNKRTKRNMLNSKMAKNKTKKRRRALVGARSHIPGHRSA